jgi:hypothetical protein
MPIFKGLNEVGIALSNIGVGRGSMSTRGIVDIGHVLEVCLNPSSPLYKSPKDIGKIRYRSSVIVNAYTDSELNAVAYPLDRSVARYPFPGELVVLFAVDGEPREESEQPIDTTIFYTTVVSALHNVSYNSHPFFIADASTVVPQNTPTLSAEGRFEKLVDDISLVKTTQNKIKIHKQLQPFEGDFILQGRYGNSIRFGATALTTKAPWTDGTTGVSGDPVIAIRVDRQTTDQENDMFVVEDINNDDTSIYLTTSQPVKLNLASSALLEPWSRSNFNGISTLRTVIGVSGSAPNVNDILKVTSLQTGKQNNYKGSQLLTNSDRIILNAREDYLMMFGSRGIIMSSPEEIKIDTDLSITLFGGGGVHLGAPNELAIKNANTKAPDAGNYAQPTVDNTYEPLVLGQKLYDLLDDIIDVLTSSEIVTPVGKASFNQDTLYRLKSIKARLPEFKSTTVFVDGVSHDSVLEAPIPPAPEPVVQETGTLVVQPQSFVEVSAGEVVSEGDLIDVQGLVYVVETDVTDNNSQTFPQGIDAIESERALIVIDGQAVLKPVALAYLKMRDAAKRDSVTLKIKSGFRPAFGNNPIAKTSNGKTLKLTSQYTLRKDRGRWVNRASYKGTDEDFILKAPSSNFSPATAPPKVSKHGLGLALDLNTGGRNNFQPLQTENYVWLAKNAHKFGFVRTVATEEWHWEYLPVKAKNGPYAVLTNKNKFYADLGLNNLTV